MSLLERIKSELLALESAGKLRTIEPVTRPTAGRAIVRGRNFLDFSSWDIFNFTQHPRIIAAATETLIADGLAGRSARTSSGSTPSHILGENRLAKFLGSESSLLFSSVNQAVWSLFGAVLDTHDFVLVEESLQTPIQDAAFLAQASVATFRAEDPEGLERELLRNPATGQRFVVCEGLSAAMGTVPDLSRIVRICQAAGAHCIVDESSSLGLLGVRGAGACEHHKLLDGIFCRFGDLSRALSLPSGFVAGSAALCGYIVQRSRTFASDPSSTPFVGTTLERVIDTMELLPVHRARALGLAQRAVSSLFELGYRALPMIESPLISIRMRNLNAAQALKQELYDRSVLVDALGPAYLRDETASLRLIVSSFHTEEDVAVLLNTMAELRRRIPAL